MSQNRPKSEIFCKDPKNTPKFFRLRRADLRLSILRNKTIKTPHNSVLYNICRTDLSAPGHLFFGLKKVDIGEFRLYSRSTTTGFMIQVIQPTSSDLFYVALSHFRSTRLGISPPGHHMRKNEEMYIFKLEKLQFDAAKPAKSHTILTLRNAKG